MVSRRRHLAILFASALAALAAVWAYALHVPADEGRIGEILNPDEPADQWRYGPVPHAQFLVVWYGHSIGGRDYGPGYCLRSKYVRTDANGYFRVPAWWMKRGWPLMRDTRASHFPVPGFSRELWLNDKYPAPGDFTIYGARDLPDPNPVPDEFRPTLKEMTGCEDPPEPVSDS